MASKVDVQGIIQYGRQALEYLPETEINWRSLTTMVLGDAHAYEGDTTAAYRSSNRGIEGLEGDRQYLLVTGWGNLKLASTLRHKVVTGNHRDLSATDAVSK